jgi:single-stranded-DNA-specific exonuclease
MRWVFEPDPGQAVDSLAEQLNISRITALLLAQRLPAASPEEAKRFLRPSLVDMHSPWDFAGMEIAAGRLAKAIHDREKIAIHGDYDTDGVTATAVLERVFKALGNPAKAVLPCRMEGGYGISREFVEQMIAEKFDVVVTVDCGTSENERIAELTAAGIDVIVTDHHEPGGQELPAAFALINPKLEGSNYPFRELVGVGVAFKLAWALCEEVMGSPRVGERLQKVLLSLLPVVALGTIADVAPLVGENRVYVWHGLRSFSEGSPGLKALLEVGGQDASSISSRDVAFHIAPRINAAGRMGEADMALHLLVEEDPAAAAELARELNRQNLSRQKVGQTMMAEAEEEVTRTFKPETDSVIVVAREGWHEGVIGIVAGRLAEKYSCPAVVIAFSSDKDKGKGSARSVEGINLYEAMNICRERFVTFGGHEQAAGFSLNRDQVDGLRDDLNRECRAQLGKKSIEPKLGIDAEIFLRELNIELVNEINMLAPFGQGNPAPCFISRNIRIVGAPKVMGSTGRHFSFNASQNGVAYRAVVFNNIQWLREIDRGAREWDIAFSADLNLHWGQPRLELKIADMRPS